MERIDYITSSYGAFTLTTPQVSRSVKRVSNNTVFTTTGLSPSQFGHVRSGHTNNPVHYIAGTSTKWRSPSSYERRGGNIEDVSRGKYLLGPTQSYYVEDAPLDYSDLSVMITNASKNPWFSGSTTSQLDTSYPGLADLQNRAILKAYDDLASAKAGMGEYLATLDQTASLFADTIEASLDVFRALKALKHGRIPNILNLNVKKIRKLVYSRKLDKRLANYWLSYYYGWKPMVSDAAGLYELMLEQAQKPALLAHGRGRARESYEDSFQTKSNNAVRPGYSVNDQSNVYFECRLTGRIASNDILRTLNRTGLLNAPALGWELTPFSFAVDWGIMVSSYLNAMTATVGLEFQGGSISRSFDRTIIGAPAPAWSAGSDVYTTFRGNGVQRTAYGTWPKAHLASKPFYTGADRFATIAALLSNLTNGISRQY